MLAEGVAGRVKAWSEDRHQRTRPRAADLPALTGAALRRRPARRIVREPQLPTGCKTGFCGAPEEYDRGVRRSTLRSSRPSVAQPSPRSSTRSTSTTTARLGSKFLARLQGEIDKRGVIDVSAERRQARPASLDLFYGTPSPGNVKAAERYAQTASASRVSFATAATKRSARSTCACSSTVCRLPPLSSRTASPSRRSRMPSSNTGATATRGRSSSSSAAAWCTLPWTTARCGLHRAQGQGLVVSAVQQGLERRCGQSANPDGLKTDYLWKEILTPAGPDRYPRELRPDRREQGPRRPARRSESRFSRVITSLTWCASCLADVQEQGVGKRYLIQHSAGSGKSNSIAWLAHQLIGARTRRQGGFRFRHRGYRPAHSRRADSEHDQAVHAGGRDGRPCRSISGDLRKFIEQGKKIIVSTVQKFPFILDEIGAEARATPSPSSSMRPIPARAAKRRRP